MAKIEVRKMQESDLEKVWSLYVGDYDGFYKGVSTDERLEQNRYFFEYLQSRTEEGRALVADYLGDIQGYATYTINSDITTLMELFVKKQLRGFGIGRALVSETAKKSLEANVRKLRIQLPIIGENDAKAFYLRLGFKEKRDYVMVRGNLKQIASTKPEKPKEIISQSPITMTTPWRILFSSCFNCSR